MGTLYSQSPRQETLSSYVDAVIDVAGRLGWDRATLTADQCKAIAAIATAALAIQSADVFDEQLAELGEILQNGFSEIAEALSPSRQRVAVEPGPVEPGPIRLPDGRWFNPSKLVVRPSKKKKTREQRDPTGVVPVT